VLWSLGRLLLGGGGLPGLGADLRGVLDESPPEVVSLSLGVGVSVLLAHASLLGVGGLLVGVGVRGGGVLLLAGAGLRG